MSSLTLVRRIKARPSIVFDAITTSTGIAQWFGPDDGPVLIAESDPRVGGRFRVRFRMLDGSEHETRGDYLEVQRPVRVVMTWRWLGGAEDPGESRIDITLRAIDEGTELTFTHSRLQDEASARGHEAGWNGALDKLERHLAPAITLTAFRWVPPFARGVVRDLRVRWALEEAQLPYSVRLIGREELQSDSYRTLQPFGQVPALEIDGLKLFESGAIVWHIAERCTDLLPSAPPARARTHAWMFAALNSVEPSMQHLAGLDLFYGNEPWSREARPSAVKAVHRRLDALEAWLGDREYLEQRFTAADLLMSTVLRILRDSDVIASRPRLAAYQARCEARPSFEKALGDQLRSFVPDPP